MERFYSMTFENVGVQGAVDLFAVQSADNKPTAIVGFEIDNVGGTAQAGNDKEEFMRLAIMRNFSGLSIGNSVNPEPIVQGDQTSSGGAHYYGSSITGATGSTVTLWAGSVNLRIPQPVWFLPGCYPKTTFGQSGMVLRMLSALSTTYTLNGTLWIQELNT